MSHDEELFRDLEKYTGYMNFPEDVVREFALSQTRQFDPGLEAVAELFDEFVFGDPEKAKYEMTRFDDNIAKATIYIMSGLDKLNKITPAEMEKAIGIAKWVYMRKRITEFSENK